ncbi:hypothetical protein [uncultured Roseobacter sp.]|uniref:hypothetical protein n=1 Tax=uncultured Roseobacter sp. TaxID=114847 RepID=UPI00263675A4|nr:hypothetical protein [uncultured Roseobacter sp.]
MPDNMSLQSNVIFGQRRCLSMSARTAKRKPLRMNISAIVDVDDWIREMLAQAVRKKRKGDAPPPSRSQAAEINMLIPSAFGTALRRAVSLHWLS